MSALRHDPCVLIVKLGISYYYFPGPLCLSDWLDRSYDGNKSIGYFDYDYVLSLVSRSKSPLRMRSQSLWCESRNLGYRLARYKLDAQDSNYTIGAGARP